jgi:hypothetical protein
MVGVPHDEDDGEQQKLQQLQQEDDDGTGLHQQDKADVEDISRAATKIKKRRLYKQLSGTAVPWFPHDNAIELLKELCWEAGRPRWILHGTPAGGAGVHGCLEAGSSVVALCYDEHHRTHLKQFLSERAVEAMVSGTSLVFVDAALQARSVELKTARVPDGCISQEETDARGEALIGRARDRGEAQGQERTQTAKTQGHQHEKTARTVAVSSDSPATDNDGESDDNSDTDSKEATRTPPTKKQKRT